MATVKLYNLARMTTSTTGTGTITLGSAVTGFLSFAAAGVQDGETVRYAIEDGADSEIGYGVYTSSGTTLTRNVLNSTNSNNAISLTGGAEVFITPAAAEFLPIDTDGVIQGITITNSGLHLLDTNATHDLIISPGSNLTADRTLTITTGDADRTLTISGNATVSQDYSSSGNPQFATVELGAASDTTLSRSSAGVLAVEGVVVPTISSTNTLTNKTLTSPAINSGTIGTSLVPTSNDGAALGSSSNRFSDLFLAEGGVINWDNGDFTITQTNNALRFASGYPEFEAVNGPNGQLAGFRNALRNGSMQVAQRGTSFTSATAYTNDDGNYTLDGWVLLTNGSDTIDVTQATDAPTGGLYSIGLDVETANRKFGILQIIEQKDCIGLIGSANTVTLSFKAKVSSTTKLDSLKAAILAWDGTADAPTRDAVSSWGIEGTNPTLVSNWTYENTPSNLNPTTSWASYSVSASIDTSSTKNIGVFIWSDVTDTTVGDFLYITDVQLEIGTVATPFERIPYAVELARSQRYAYVLSGNNQFFGAGYSASTTIGVAMKYAPTPMRAVPTLAFSSAGHFTLFPTSTVATNLQLNAASTPEVVVLTLTVASGLTLGHATALTSSNASAALLLTAEL